MIKQGSRNYYRITTIGVNVDSTIKSFFNAHKEYFNKYENIWLKGGSARSTFLAYARSKIKSNYMSDVGYIRDIDLVYIGSYNEKLKKVLEEEFKNFDIEFIRSIDIYLNTRDFAINEVLLRPEEIIFSKRALNAVKKGVNELSTYEYSQSLNKNNIDNYESKKALKNILLAVRENINTGFINQDAITYAPIFQILVMLFKAYQTGVEELFFNKISETGAIYSRDFDNPDDYLLFLLKKEPSFKLTPEQSIIVENINKYNQNEETDVNTFEKIKKKPKLVYSHMINDVLIKYANTLSLKSVQDIKILLPLMVKAAQEEYDSWIQDEEGINEELGAGGICQDIAENIAGVLNDHGIEAETVSQTIGDQHVYTLTKVRDGVVAVDIEPRIYEAGSGYVWKKRPNVKFSTNHIDIYVVDQDPNKFEEMTESW